MTLLLEQDLSAIRDYQPAQRTEGSLMKAAVAMILRDTDVGTEVLLMQRAFHPRDPWSGQMAFPGGKIDPIDESAKAAAIREAEEEVGAQLREEDYLGRLDDLYGLKMNHIFSVHVSCFVFKPNRPLMLTANEEVADMVWLPLEYLAQPDNAYDFTHPQEPSLAMPAVMINEPRQQILWGMSLRMLINLYRVLGREMSALSEEQHNELHELEQRQLSDKTIEKYASK